MDRPLRANWLIQCPFTCLASSAIYTRQLDKSIKESASNLVRPLRVQASMVKKAKDLGLVITLTPAPASN